MIDQDTIGVALRARLQVYVTLARLVTTDVITEETDGVILTVLDGATDRPRLTAQGHATMFWFDVLIYFKGTTEWLSAPALKTRMAQAEAQLAAFVAAEGGNQNGWNSIDYGGRASNEQLELMTDQLDASRVIPLRVTIY